MQRSRFLIYINTCKSLDQNLNLFPEAEFLEKIQTQVLRVCYSQSPLQLCLDISTSYIFLQTHGTSYYFYIKLLYTVKEKGGKPVRKPYPLLYVFRNPYRNLKPENSQDYGHGQKPQRNCMFILPGHIFLAHGDYYLPRRGKGEGGRGSDTFHSG
jgi:hypothetical protein